MPAILRDRFFLAWLFLVAVTLLSSAIGGIGASWLTVTPVTVTFAVLGIAFAKVWVVMANFMEVRHAPMALRGLCLGWTILVLGGLLATYLGVFG